MSTSSSRDLGAVRRQTRAQWPVPVLLATVLVLALLLSPGTDPARAAETQVIKLASLIPSGSFWDRHLKSMGDTWREETAGRVQLRIYPGGVAGDDPDVLRKIRIGQLQAGTVTVSGLSDIDPAFALFEIPMFFDSFEELFHVLEGMTPVLQARLEAKGFVLLHWVQAGWVYFFTTEPVETFEELRALQVFQWAGESHMQTLWRKHGFRPVPLAGTDIPMGLRTGMFQTLPATPIAALSLQWFRLAPNMVDMGLAPLIGATLVDQRTWGKLTPEDREAALTASLEVGELFRSEIAQQDTEAVEEMRRRGLNVVRVVGTPREAAWRDAALAFADDMRSAFVPAEIYDQALELRDAYREGQAATVP